MSQRSMVEASIHLLSIEDLYAEEVTCELGQRLGVSYTKAQQDEIEIHINDEVVSILQSSLGVVAISGVVWDAGLLIVDFLVWISSNHISYNIIGDTDSRFYSRYFSEPVVLGKVLDLGCGTGVAGIAACKLRASSVIFSDYRCTCEDNIASYIDGINARFVEYDWTRPLIDELKLVDVDGRQEVLTWDTVLCSDVVYENKLLGPLFERLSELAYRRLIITYKRRHDEQEREFFEKLSSICDLCVLKPENFPLVNLPITSTQGLYVVLGIKKDLS
jgi:SAM-dependent methyltransferase